MPDIDVNNSEESTKRPPCYQCGEPYELGDADRHLKPVDCTACPRCKGQPACWTCRNMYCSCEVHQH